MQQIRTKSFLLGNFLFMAIRLLLSYSWQYGDWNSAISKDITNLINIDGHCHSWFQLNITQVSSHVHISIMHLFVTDLIFNFDGKKRKNYPSVFVFFSFFFFLLLQFSRLWIFRIANKFLQMIKLLKTCL